MSCAYASENTEISLYSTGKKKMTDISFVFNSRLLDMIQDYWRDKGYDVNASVEVVGHHRVGGSDDEKISHIYGIRSDMVNGRPVALLAI